MYTDGIVGLEIENMCVSYGEKQVAQSVLEGFSVKIREKETLAILGASGSGKSTLIKTLAGEINLEQGSVKMQRRVASGVRDRQGRQVCEEVWEPLNHRKHRVAIIPQAGGLLPWRTLEQNCRLPLKLRGEETISETKNGIKNMLEFLGIQELSNKYPRDLSGGENQRGAIAQGFIQRPELLLMDEPFSALDEINREKAREVFFRIWNMYRPITILVTHSIEEALYLGTHVGVMDKKLKKLCYLGKNHFFSNLEPMNNNYTLSNEGNEAQDYLLIKRKLKEMLNLEN